MSECTQWKLNGSESEWEREREWTICKQIIIQFWNDLFVCNEFCQWTGTLSWTEYLILASVTTKSLFSFQLIQLGPNAKDGENQKWMNETRTMAKCVEQCYCEKSSRLNLSWELSDNRTRFICYCIIQSDFICVTRAVESCCHAHIKPFSVIYHSHSNITGWCQSDAH